MAYRQMAMKCHPDRGGSHAQMVEVNEAFEVLSDPRLRETYDYSITHPQDAEARVRASTESAQAQEKAQNYPRDWASFETWMRDIIGVTYDTGCGPMGIPLPKPKRGIIGWIFVLVGGGVGFVVGSVIVYLFCQSLGISPDQDRSRFSTGFFVLFSVCIAIGAWLGASLHLFIGWIIGLVTGGRSSSSPPPPGSSHQIVQCPSCSQRLRLPSVAGAVRVTCVSCRNVFLFDPSARQGP